MKLFVTVVLSVFAFAYGSPSGSSGSAGATSGQASIAEAQQIPSILQKYVNEASNIQEEIHVLGPVLDVLNIPSQDKVEFMAMESLLKDDVAQLKTAVVGIKQTVQYLLGNCQQYKTSQPGIYNLPKKQFESIGANVGKIQSLLFMMQYGLQILISSVQGIEGSEADLLQGASKVNLKALAAANAPKIMQDATELGNANEAINTFMTVFVASPVHGKTVSLNLPVVLNNLMTLVNQIPNFDQIVNDVITTFGILALWTTQPGNLFTAL